MQTHEHLFELVAYNEWANSRVAASLEAADSERSRQILSHIVTTEGEYLERFDGKDLTGFNFWPELTIGECEQQNLDNGRRYRALVNEAGEAALDRVLHYKNSRGESHENTIRELVSHVLIHSAIHRGNIILKLRESGFEPPKTDNLVYLRETKRT